MIFSLVCQNGSSSVSSLDTFNQKVHKSISPVLALVVFVCGMAVLGKAQTAAYNGGVTSTINSSFSIPMGVTTDSSGNLFVADNLANTSSATIYKLSRTGPGAYGSPVALPGPVGGYLCPASITEP